MFRNPLICLVRNSCGVRTSINWLSLFLTLLLTPLWLFAEYLLLLQNADTKPQQKDDNKRINNHIDPHFMSYLLDK